MSADAIAQKNASSGTITEQKINEPARYRVLLHNDDYTTFDFVILILRKIFNKSAEEAQAITLHVHKSGIGQCGIFTREIAEAKVARVRHEARLAGYPLKCSMEKL